MKPTTPDISIMNKSSPIFKKECMHHNTYTGISANSKNHACMGEDTLKVYPPAYFISCKLSFYSEQKA